MTYLSQLFLNARSRQVRSELANPYEMHRTVMHAFTGRIMEGNRVLFRLDTHDRTELPVLLVQSPLEPDWSFLAAAGKNYLLPLAECPPGVNKNPAVKVFSLKFHPGQQLMFRLKANPTVKKTVQEEGQVARKIRHGLMREEDQLKWLERKLDSAGAGLISARTAHNAWIKGERRQADEHQALSFLSVQFDGVLTVLEPEKFLTALPIGFGSGKGLGFGLLSLAPLRE